MVARIAGILTLLALASGYWWLTQPVKALGTEPATTLTQVLVPTAPLQVMTAPAQRLSNRATSEQDSTNGLAIQADFDETQFDAQARQELAWQELAGQWQQQLAMPGNAQSWLSQHARHCLTDACQALLVDLKPWLNPQEWLLLQSLFQAWPVYWQAQAERSLPTSLSPEQRFDEISSIRQQYFGSDYHLLFGHEHRFAQQQFAFNVLLDQASELSSSQRLAEFWHWHQQTQQQLKLIGQDELFGPDQAVQQAMLLLEDLPEAEREPLINQLQQQLFADQWPEVAAHQQRLDQQQQVQQAYQQELQQLNQWWAERSNMMSPEAWQQGYLQALNELRWRHFPQQ